MGRQPAQEWYEVAVAVPLNSELEVWNRSQAAAREQGLDVRLVPEPLELLLMHQKELDHARILQGQRLHVLVLEIFDVLITIPLPQASLQILAHLGVPATLDEGQKSLGASPIALPLCPPNRPRVLTNLTSIFSLDHLLSLLANSALTAYFLHYVH